MTTFGYGHAGIAALGSINGLRFAIEQIISENYSAMPVIVQAAYEDRVDVMIAINKVDGIGNTFPSATIFNVPVALPRCGNNAISMTPEKGDLGLLVVCDRDISALKESKKESPPGSFRINNLADGVYLPSILNPSNPNQAIAFTNNGILIYDKNGNSISMNQNGIVINGNVSISGSLTVNVGGNPVDLTTHIHDTPRGPSGPPRGPLG